MDKEVVICTKKLVIGYPGRVVVSDISFRIERGEVVALLGRNGCGKSTLLRSLTGRLASMGGEIFISGRRLCQISRKDMAKEIALVVIDNIRDINLTVRETVELGRHPYTGFLGSLGRLDRELVEMSMRATGIESLAGRSLNTLSDGERQKVSIARALAQDTPIMLLDEPFSFIDVAARLELLRLLKKIAGEKRKTLLFSTHDVAQAFRYADRLLCFTTDGRLEYGTPVELISRQIPDRLFNAEDVRFDPEMMDYRLK